MAEHSPQSPLPPWSRAMARAALIPLLLAALAVRLVFLNEGYFDFGDGNYLYIAWRLGEGARLYADILSPQPPLHLHLGMVILWVGDWLGHPTITIRAVQALVRVGTAWLVYLLARRWGMGRGTSVLASAIFLLCPIGDRWSHGWQSENIEIPLLLGMLILLERRGNATLLLAGLCAAGALLCNMTAAPYVLFSGLFALVAFRARGLLYWLGLLGAWGLTALFFEITTGAFFENVVLNQVGAYPDEGFWSYAMGKLQVGMAGVLRAEGVWTILGLAGLLGWAGAHLTRWNDPRAVHRVIFSLGGFLSITYVTKGGTVDYIFCLAEPFVGIWAAWMLVFLARAGECRPIERLGPQGRAFFQPLFLALAVSLFFLGALLALPIFVRMLSQRGYEWPEERMALVVDQIEAHTEPGDLILAPPYFAHITRRPLVEDFSSTYLWYIKWLNEVREEEEGRGVAMMERIAEQIRAGDVKLIALNGLSPELVERTADGETVAAEEGLENRYIAQIAPIRAALVETCRRVGPRVSLASNLMWGRSRVLPTLAYAQEELTFWVPREPDDE